MHPLPAIGEDELGVNIQTTINVANTAAGSGLHDADCSASFIMLLVARRNKEEHDGYNYENKPSGIP